MAGRLVKITETVKSAVERQMREDDKTTAGQLRENYLHAVNSLCMARTCERGYAQSLIFVQFHLIVLFFHFVQSFCSAFSV